MVPTITYEKYLERMRKLAHDLENGIECVESYELHDEGVRLWNLIKENLLKAAKREVLAKNNLVEIVKTDIDRITIFISRTKAREVKSFKIIKEIPLYNLMLRVAILAEPYGLKVVSRGASSNDEHWGIEFVK